MPVCVFYTIYIFLYVYIGVYIGVLYIMPCRNEKWKWNPWRHVFYINLHPPCLRKSPWIYIESSQKKFHQTSLHRDYWLNYDTFSIPFSLELWKNPIVTSITKKMIFREEKQYIYARYSDDETNCFSRKRIMFHCGKTKWRSTMKMKIFFSSYSNIHHYVEKP